MRKAFKTIIWAVIICMISVACAKLEESSNKTSEKEMKKQEEKAASKISIQTSPQKEVNQTPKEKKQTDTAAIPNKVNSALENDMNKYAGVYKYNYKYNTENSIEDHYIVLEYKDGAIQGRYYGTSDDFDEGREGYKAGFFVSNMKELKIKDNIISFDIQLQNIDVFTKPIDIAYKSSKEISLDKNPVWSIGLRKFSHSYSGEIINGEIQLKDNLETRIFKRLN